MLLRILLPIHSHLKRIPNVLLSFKIFLKFLAFEPKITSKLLSSANGVASPKNHRHILKMFVDNLFWKEN